MTAETTTGIRQWWADHPDEQEAAEGFLRALILDTGEKWDSVLQPWQVALYASVLGFPDAPCGDKQLVECCGIVGAGKDQIIAASVLAALHFGPKGLIGKCYSTDRGKSKEVIECIEGFLLRDDRSGIGVSVYRGVIRNICEDENTRAGCKKDTCEGGRRCSAFKDATMHKAGVPGGPGSRGGVVACESADESSAVGVIYDVAWINEPQAWVHHTAVNTYSHVFARFGKRKGRVAVFSNAPKTERGEWRRDRWEEARREGSDWWYIEATVDDCPWVSEDYVALQQRNLPTLQFLRWYYLKPSDGGGDLLTGEEIDRCTFGQLAPAVGPKLQGKRFAGIDIGVKQDHAAIFVACLVPTGAVFVERIDLWVPALEVGGEVPLADVEAQLLEYGKKWRAHLLFDPSQAQSMRQNLVAKGVKCDEVNATPKNLSEQTNAILELFRSQRIRIFPNAGFKKITETVETSFRAQLLAATVKEQEKDSGVRIVHKRTKAGHGDQAAAFAMVAQRIVAEGKVVKTACVGGAKPEPSAAPGRPVRGRNRLRDLTSRHSGKFIGPGKGRRRTA